MGPLAFLVLFSSCSRQQKARWSHSPTGFSNELQPCRLVTMTTAAKINVSTGQADVRSGAAAMAVTVAMRGGRAAAVAHRAPAIDRAAVAVAAHNAALAEDTRAAGAAGVGEAAAAGAAMGVRAAAVMSLGGSRSHDGKTGGDCQESDDLFHSDWARFDCFVFDLLPHHLQLWIQTRVCSAYSSIHEIFSAHSSGCQRTNLKIG